MKKRPALRPVDEELFNWVKADNVAAIQDSCRRRVAAESSEGGGVLGWWKRRVARAALPNLKARGFFRYGFLKAPEGCTRDVMTPLMLAIVDKKEVCAVALAAHWQPPRSSKAFPDDLDFWALPWACERGQVEVVHTLLTRAGKIGAQSRLNLKAALQACTRNPEADLQGACLRLLLRSVGFERRVLDVELRTAIEAANRQGAVRELLAFNPDLVTPGLAEGGRSEEYPLRRAVAQGRLHSVKILLPYHSAAQLRETFEFALTSPKASLEGATKSSRNSGVSLLMLAAQGGHAEVLRMLLPHCDAAQVDKNGCSALDYALRSVALPCVDMLAALEPIEKIQQILLSFETESRQKHQLLDLLLGLNSPDACQALLDRMRSQFPMCYARLERQSIEDAINSTSNAQAQPASTGSEATEREPNATHGAVHEPPAQSKGSPASSQMVLAQEPPPKPRRTHRL